MPHAKEHPLAGRRVVPHSGSALGSIIYVVEWVDRVPGLAASGLPGAGAPNPVLVRNRRELLVVPDADLPVYDPVPVGFVS